MTKVIKDKVFEIIIVDELISENIHESTGLVIHNCRNCVFVIKQIKNFYTGLIISSNSSHGCVNNTFYLMGLINNKHNLDLVQSEKGWVNQNTFIGGHLAHYSYKGLSYEEVPKGIYDTGDYSQIRLIQKEGSIFGAPDNNIFLNTNIEGPRAKYFIECAGTHNVFDNLRYERGYGVKDHRVKINGKRNTIRGGFDSNKLAVEGDMPILDSMSLSDKLKIYFNSLLK